MIFFYNLSVRFNLYCTFKLARVRIMVFNVTFNNISVISWWTTEYPEKATDLPQVTDKLSHNVVSSTPCNERDNGTHSISGDKH